MAEIPHYFHQIFQSVKTLEAHIKEQGSFLDLCQQEQLAISELSKQTVIASPAATYRSTQIQLNDDIHTIDQVKMDSIIYLV